MVCSRVDMIHADSIGANRLHQSSVEFALVGVHERVGRRELVSNSCAILGQVHAKLVRRWRSEAYP